ncbi:hypothetical protein P3L10_016227 [Capsicum annuum]
MIEYTNPESKTVVHVDENGRFKYFFVSYDAWIQGFWNLRKGITIDGTFLRSRYNGVLLAAVAHDAKNHIFPVSFCKADKECDASYEFLFEQLRSCIEDTKELCFVLDRHPSIPKMDSIFFTSAYFGCCIRHLGENIQTNNHNKRVVTHFYRVAKVYNREKFLDHFNQIIDVNPKVAELLVRVNFERWSRAFYQIDRYNIMTSRIAELVNSLFDDEREFL